MSTHAREHPEGTTLRNSTSRPPKRTTMRPISR